MPQRIDDRLRHVIVGTEITKNVITCLDETMSLMKKAFTIPTSFQGQKLQGIYLSNAIKSAKERPPDPNSTFLEAPNYLLNSLTQQVVDETKLQEVVDKLELENEVLLSANFQETPPDASQIETFQYDAMITQPNAKDIRVRVQIDTGSPDSFVSEDVVRRAKLQIIPNEAETVYTILNGNDVVAKNKVWVQWYAISSALTRVTKCNVMADLPVDILIGRTHIAEYNLLAINRAKGAFPVKANISKTNRARLNSILKEKEAEKAGREEDRGSGHKKGPPPPIPRKSPTLRRESGTRSPSINNLVSPEVPVRLSENVLRRSSSQISGSSDAPTSSSSTQLNDSDTGRKSSRSSSKFSFLSPAWNRS